LRFLGEILLNMLYDVIILKLSTFHYDYMTVCDYCDYDITLNPNPK